MGGECAQRQGWTRERVWENLGHPCRASNSDRISLPILVNRMSAIIFQISQGFFGLSMSYDQKTMKACPLIWLTGTVPQVRLSLLWSRLSPMAKTCPFGTVKGLPSGNFARNCRDGSL